MKLANFAEEQLKAFAALEKRFSAKPTRALADSLTRETIAAQIGNIEQRIDRLEQHKKATLARIETALASEYEALEAIKRHAAGLPGAEPSPKTAKGAKSKA